jgi:FtsP/CotA-like multicopper oxidase with cupredoxin domain
MRAWAWAGLVLSGGCRGRPRPGGGESGGGDGGGADTAESPRPPFANPSEAEDLDPADDVVHVRLTASYFTHALGPAQGFAEQRDVDGYAYNGLTPGPTIRARRGDTLVVEFENELMEDTTIHWHGLEVPYEMDGVTWQMEPVGRGESFTYRFPLLRAGTFWYHPHFDTESQVDLGLYGALVVEDPADPPAERELVLVLDAWGEWVDDGDSGGGGHRAVAPDSGGGHGGGGEHDGEGLGTEWSVNGLLRPALSLGADERVRVRIVNASNTGYAWLVGPGQRQIASDQGLLPALALVDELLLAPGDRAELEWLPGRAAPTLHARPYSFRGGPSLGATLPVVELRRAAGPALPGLPWPFPGGAVSADPGRTDVRWTFQGSDEGGGWAMNGEQFPDVTIPEVARGAETVVEVRNLSASEHPFHLHGSHFEVLSVDGVPPAVQTLEDTVNVPMYGVVRLRVVPGEAGDWMAHCHILDHADGGMMSVLRVADAAE